MEKKAKWDVVLIALFFGVILTFSLFYGITSFSYHGNTEDGPKLTENTVLTSFSRAFYGNSELKKFRNNIDYNLFGSIDSNDIIVGKNEFLFDIRKTDNGYSYLGDYLGKTEFCESELQALANVLLLRKLAYENNNTAYLFVVIPNSQTVYSENMPDYIGKISENTRLNQLTGYIKKRGYDFYIDTTDILRNAKGSGLLYNNTENSLNARGALTVFDYVCKKVNELYGIDSEKTEVSPLSLYTRVTEGKALAKRAGLSDIIKNVTTSLSDDFTDGYTVSDYYGTMIKTYAEDSGNDHVLLLEFTDDWDRILMMPYFSNGFSGVAYKTNHQFSGLVTEDLSPDVVIQFIREDELYDIIDNTTVVTYNAGLRMDINDEVTSQPIITSKCAINDHTVCIAGEAESGAVLTLMSGEKIIAQQTTKGSLFIMSIDMRDKEYMEVSLVSNVMGKEQSPPLQFSLYADRTAKEKNVAVGSNSQLFITDFPNLKQLDENSTESVANSIAENVLKTNEITAGKSEYVYVIVPDKLNVYNERLTKDLQAASDKLEEYRRTVGEIRGKSGMTVLDLTDSLKQSTTLGSLYYQTGTLWTSYGAYTGYYELMKYISQRFDNVSPHDLLLDYKVGSAESIGGELIRRLGLDGAVISETYMTITPTYEKRARYEFSGTGEFDRTDSFVSFVDDGTLPTAIVMRDAYGTEMLENMSEHFSKMVVLKEDEFRISNELINEIQPDYIITIRYNGSLS